jgi:hypothetical protein
MLAALALLLVCTPTRIRAADLRAETIQAWNDYVKAASIRNQERLQPGSPFLSSDQIPGQAARLRHGEIVISPAGPNVPLKVPSGLIHDWTGAAFVPNTTLAEVLLVIRDYGHYKDFYRPNVIDSKLISQAKLMDRFSILLMNQSVVGKTALDTSYESAHTRLDDRRWHMITETTHVQEIANYGTPSQHVLPKDKGTGLIWRLYSISRLEERDGGVYIEVEAIALSRDIPLSLRWVVSPIVRRISRSSLATSLQQTEEAVRSGDALARNPRKTDMTAVISSVQAFRKTVK